MSKISLKVSAAAAALAAATSLAAPVATAQQVNAPQMSSVGNFLGLNEDQAWNTRNVLYRQIDGLNNPALSPGLKAAVDGTVNSVFPGLVARKNAEARAAYEAAAKARAEQAAREQAAAEAAARAAEEERRRNEFNPGTCPADARVCVDIDGRRTWIQGEGGKVEHIASAMAPGKPGHETPRGTFYINRKVKDEVSYIFGNAPMPYAMYFTNQGHAFHQGNPAYDSHGCVRLPMQDAIYFWDHVNIGDKVVIY